MGPEGLGYLDCVGASPFTHSTAPLTTYSPLWINTVQDFPVFFSHDFIIGLHRPDHRHLDTFPFNCNLPWLIVPACWDRLESQLCHPVRSLPTLCHLLRIWKVCDLSFYYQHWYTCGGGAALRPAGLPAPSPSPPDTASLTNCLSVVFCWLGYVSSPLPMGDHKRSCQILRWSPRAPCLLHCPH